MSPYFLPYLTGERTPLMILMQGQAFIKWELTVIGLLLFIALIVRNFFWPQ